MQSQRGCLIKVEKANTCFLDRSRTSCFFILVNFFPQICFTNCFWNDQRSNRSSTVNWIAASASVPGASTGSTQNDSYPGSTIAGADIRIRRGSSRPSDDRLSGDDFRKARPQPFCPHSWPRRRNEETLTTRGRISRTLGWISASLT
ncbi:hypothetical protein L596_004465 [Steinernema carpocapsae]|uniref:Uncharacterized protein n=1 Tax=Steinernema carpocapsae TaxID=34508 RepID=A0A4U8UW25_STECR|nr:hypothetical protein L596_004465 [Steinernema carpocapsae]